MSDQERLAEVAALLIERKRVVEGLTAIDRKIELVLFPDAGEKRKKKTLSVMVCE